MRSCLQGLSEVLSTGDLARNPGMRPDWESTGHPLVRRPALNPLSHTSQGSQAEANTYKRSPFYTNGSTYMPFRVFVWVFFLTIPS